MLPRSLTTTRISLLMIYQDCITIFLQGLTLRFRENSVRQRSIIIVPETVAKLANEAAHEINPEGGDNFTVRLLDKLSLDSKVTPDYYVCNWQFENNERAAFEAACKLRGIWSQMKVHDLDDPDPAIAKPTFETVKIINNVKDKPESTMVTK